MFANKVAVVTGGGRGIGKEIALKLGSLGARVAVNYLKNADEAASVVAQLIEGGGEAKIFQADVSRAVECDAMMEQVYREFGSIDLLASNAGVEHFAPLEEISEGDLTRVFGTNVFGQLYITKAACDYMEDGASIVLTSSISAQLSIFHHTLYAASKAAVSAMARNLAPELGARGIRINAIAPGGTATSMASAAGAQYVHPLLQGTVDPDLLIKSSNALQRLAEPKEIAAAIAFLLSDEASFISGLTLSVDGGIVA